MSMEITEDRGLDRAFLDLSSKMAEPLCQAFGLLRFRLVAPLDPKKFDNCESKIAEVALRVVIGVTAVFLALPLFLPAVVLGLGSKLFRSIGFSLQKQSYTHVQGSAPEKKLEGGARVMTWNVCGIGGGMHYDHGGVIDWRSRLDGIIEKIKKEDPDVLVLQEIYP